MKLRLIHKLLIALFVSTSVVLLLILWLAQVNIGRGFEDFLLQQERARLPLVSQTLADWYRQSDGWDDLQSRPRRFHNIFESVLSESQERRPRPNSRPPRPGDGPPAGHKKRPVGADKNTPLHQRIFLLDKDNAPVVGRVPADFDSKQLVAIEVDSITVGWLGIAPLRGLHAPAEQAFAKQLNQTLLIGGAIGLMVAALLAWLLSRHIGKPLTAAAAGVRELVAGNYQTQVAINGNDETARLAKDINQLAATLGDHEVSRQRWVADIAHELRTPLAIMRGEIEAMTDGVRELNNDNLASVQQEVGHLSALVDDLHKLAMSDTGALSFKMQRLDLASLIDAIVEAYSTRCDSKGLELTLSGSAQAIWVDGDEQRLRQLLHNLLENSIRYSDAPGQINLTYKQSNKDFILTISDSSPGVSDGDLGKLFDRLYRVEASRNRNTGGSGLGLAICKNIVLAHDGQIDATHGPLGGISMTVRLPLA